VFEGVVCRNAFVGLCSNNKSMHACVLGACICVHTRFVVIDAFEDVCSLRSSDFANTINRPIWSNLQKGCILYQSYYRRPKMNSKRVLLPKIVRSHVCRFSQISADSEQNHARKVIIWNQSALLCTSCWLLKKLNRNRFRGGLMTITKCAMKQSLHRSLEEICHRIVN
jgi:hypothetical protein